MKKQLLILLLACLASISASAYDFEVDGIYYNKNGSEATVTSGTSYSGEVIIPSTVTYDGTTYSVTAIGDEAFRDCIHLTSVTIPNSVTSIGNYAFNGCSGLTSVTIPDSVTSIGDYVFSNCRHLTEVTIPNSVTTIGEDAFLRCSGLTSVTIGNSVTSIGNNAFMSCYSLTSVTIPDSVTSIGERAFQYCSGLTSVTIGNSVTGIGNSAFESCSGLTSVTIPDSVTKIDERAFARCSSLTSVTIPNSVTSIGRMAFAYCSGLTSITVENDNPANISLDSDVFFSVDTNTCILYVPAESINLYYDANQWKDFRIINGIIIQATSVELDKTTLTISIGDYARLDATVLPENTTDKTVTWTSSDEDVATVDATGKVTAIALGTATITATCGEVFATCEVTVKPIVATWIKLNKTTLTMAIGASEAIVATVFPENATDKTVTWRSSNAVVATVNADGNVTAIAAGTATITATCGEVSATCLVNVNPIVATSVELNKTTLTMAIGSSETLVANVLPENATDKTVIWTSSNESVATVNAEGNVTAVSVGNATITATCGQVSATCKVTVNPIVATSVELNTTTLTMAIGASETLVANVLPENATDKTVTWRSSDETVATVDAYGKVTAIALGTATITATCGEASAKCEVTVNPVVAENVELNKITLTLNVGEEETLVATVLPANATDKTVTWTSSDEAVATVDAEGNVTAIAAGNATITASCGQISATCEVTVNPIVATSVELNVMKLELPIGESATLVATVLPENTTDKTVTWTSSDEDVATVDADGNVTALSTGTATITATCGEVYATCEVTVNDSPTAVKDVNNDAVYMHAEGCELVIAGLADEVSVNVFTQDGKLVYNGKERRITLQNGNVYLIAYPGGSRKIAF